MRQRLHFSQRKMDKTVSFLQIPYKILPVSGFFLNKLKHKILDEALSQC